MFCVSDLRSTIEFEFASIILDTFWIWLSIQVSGFVASLRMFFSYGFSSRTQFTRPVIGQKENELSLASLKSSLEEPKKTNHSPYRPPHLRKRDGSNLKQNGDRGSQGLSDQESSTLDFTSSDSDYSDSDGSMKDTESIQKSKVRVAAIVCIQVSFCITFWFLPFLSKCQVIRAIAFLAPLLFIFVFIFLFFGILLGFMSSSTSRPHAKYSSIFFHLPKVEKKRKS